MTRTLTIAAAEWASAKDGTLWLVRDTDICTDRRHYILRPSAHNPLGTRRNDVHDDIRCANPCSNATDGVRRLVHQVPVEFVQACSPCKCKGTNLTMWDGMNPQRPCPACRIELVVPCLLCGGSGRTLHGPLGEDVGDCRCAMTDGLAVIGHAYAVGQPLPIVSRDHWNFTDPPPVPCVVATPTEAILMPIDGEASLGITAALAHYGPPESLVGKWAIELAVQP